MNNDYLNWLLREAYTRDEAMSFVDWIAVVVLAAVILAVWG